MGEGGLSRQNEATLWLGTAGLGGGGGGMSSPMLLPQIWHYWKLLFKNNTEF